jgi:GTPase SAR1 family protein
MPSKIALFGPIASGKSTLLNRAKEEIPNCISIELDDITLDQSQQQIFANAFLRRNYSETLVMSAGKLHASDLKKWGCKVVRIRYSNEAAYMPFVRIARSALIGKDYSETELETWYRQITQLPSGLLAAEITPDLMTEDQSWGEIQKLV